MTDEEGMKLALLQAKKALDAGEVPVGAILVNKDGVISSEYNHKESHHNATEHAEIRCIKDASFKLGDWRLCESTVFVTLEPCQMCASALIQSRVSRIVYGAPDYVMGGFSGKCDVRLGHGSDPLPVVLGGVLELSSQRLLDEFFDNLRRK